VPPSEILEAHVGRRKTLERSGAPAPKDTGKAAWVSTKLETVLSVSTAAAELICANTATNKWTRSFRYLFPGLQAKLAVLQKSSDGQDRREKNVLLTVEPSFDC
jgi:hypothetical protein